MKKRSDSCLGTTFKESIEWSSKEEIPFPRLGEHYFPRLYGETWYAQCASLPLVYSGYQQIVRETWWNTGGTRIILLKRELSCHPWLLLLLTLPYWRKENKKKKQSLSKSVKNFQRLGSGLRNLSSKTSRPVLVLLVSWIWRTARSVLICILFTHQPFDVKICLNMSLNCHNRLNTTYQMRANWYVLCIFHESSLVSKPLFFFFT